MATFGNNGDRVLHKIKQKYAIIIDNQIQIDNKIKIQIEGNDGIISWFITNLTLIKKENTTTDWVFKAASPKAIDWPLIVSELSHEKPILLITITIEDTEEHYVAIHYSIYNKAFAIKCRKPPITSKSPHQFVSRCAGKANYYSDWINWVKFVRNAKWKEADQKETTVEIKALEI